MGEKNDPDTYAIIQMAYDLAQQRFLTRFNCAESTFWGISQALGLPVDDPILRAMTPFGGGIAARQEMCGTLSAAILALGIGFGRTTPDEDLKLACYRRVRRLIKRFEDQTGSIICAKLNPEGLSRPDIHEHCSKFVRLSAQLGARALLDAPPELKERMNLNVPVQVAEGGPVE